MYENLPKEDLVEMAVAFFSNPEVRKCPFSQQEEFLKKKGLTPEQIKTAYEKSFGHMINVPAVENVKTVQSTSIPLKLSWFHKLKDLFRALAFLVGASYGFYYLYKRFVKPFLFGKPKKPKAIETSLNNLSQTVEKSIGDLRVDVQIIQNELRKVVLMQSDYHNNLMQLEELRSEVASVKTILLSRREYTKISIPAIPNWQVCTDSQKSEKDDKEIIEGEEGEPNGGSCETVCSANANSNGGSQGSDSSLEMIKEVDA